MGDARPVDLTDALPKEESPVFRVRAATLEILAGPDSGRRVRVEGPTFTIGTGEGASLRLADATISREHLRLALTPAGVQLRDPGSKNGTWIGSTRISDVLVTTNVTVRLGGTDLALIVDSGSLELPLSRHTRFGNAIGVSNASRHLFALLERAARSEVTVLLEGESGVGKEILARAIHENSRRADGPFVALDCGAIPAGLIESELFGHEKGAYTGANQARPGVFQLAHGGSLFLDELGELPLDLQPKLLRVLEQREVRPLGAKNPINVEVRVIAATNRQLAESVRRKEFRQDLYYRLAVARVFVPPLRDRPEDILPIAQQFIRVASGDEGADISEDLANLLNSYSWPGNVRELRNVIERYTFLGVRDPRSLFDSSQQVAPPGEENLSHLPYHEARRIALARFERGYFPEVLKRSGGVVSRAAELAQIARPSFYRILERLGISRSGESESGSGDGENDPP